MAQPVFFAFTLSFSKGDVATAGERPAQLKIGARRGRGVSANIRRRDFFQILVFLIFSFN